MDNFSFYSPTYFSFGQGSLSGLGALVQRFGGHKVLVHYGGGSAERSGVLGQVRAALQAAGVPFTELGGVRPNPRSGLVYQGIELCRAFGADLVLAVGGGSVIDSAKAIALGAVYDGDFWDLYALGATVQNALPVGAVLTIAAAGSEGSPVSVITQEKGMYKRGGRGEALRPKFAVMDPTFTYSLPAYQTACGATDILAHICERYFTPTTGAEVTDRLCEALLQTVIHQAPRALEQPDDYEARANLMWAGMLAHNDTCGVGRRQDWASHALEHELSALYDCAHGAGLAVMMPAWMKYVMPRHVARFAQFAVQVWGCQMDFERPERTAAEGIRRLEQFLAGLGMPLTFAQLGAREEDIPRLIETLCVNKAMPFGGLEPLGPEDAAAIYRLAL